MVSFIIGWYWSTRVDTVDIVDIHIRSLATMSKSGREWKTTIARYHSSIADFVSEHIRIH